MKKKKGTIGLIAILLIIVLLGVGYAAITKTLTITGSATASINNSNFKIGFTDASETTASRVEAVADSITVTPGSYTNYSEAATLVITGMTAINDSVTVVFTIENGSTDLSATLTAPTTANGYLVNGNTDYFEVTATLGATSLDPGDSTTCTVVVTCVKTPSDNAQTSNITISVPAEAVEAS